MEIVSTNICPVCHQSIKPEYYFCPNCGHKINTPPLSTSIATQAWIYTFSIILPIICFIFITRWQGIQYLKSHDSKTKRIGIVALTLLILSTIGTTWWATIFVQQQIQSSVNSINSDLNLGQ